VAPWPILEPLTMAEEPCVNRTLLALLSAGEDRTLLEAVFEGSNWRLRFIETIEEARTTLRESSIGVILSDLRYPDGYSWKDLLKELQDTADPPPLIVTDCLADEVLWVEVLNLGGFDVLMKPLVAKEVVHVVNSACRIRENESRPAIALKPAISAECSGPQPQQARVACGAA
jgi:DNA-binding NtrC family response regulator